jgi:two-component sensor histidine kinase/putative methionine-R-sulfoxide reductase with GAF domain
VRRYSTTVKAAGQQAELEALRTIGRALSSAAGLESTLQTISHTTAHVMHMDSCSIYLLEPAHQALVLKASTGLTAIGQARLRLGEGITGLAAQSGKPIAVRDAAKDARFKYLPETDEHQFKSLLAVPLVSQGTIIGAVNVQTTTYHHFPKAEIELLSLIGDLAAGALEQARLNDHLQRQVQELSALAQVSKTITAPIFLDEMLAIVMKMAAKVMHARACSLLLLEEDRKELVMRASYGLSQAHAASPPVQMQNSLAGRAMLLGEPVMARDLRSDPFYRNKKFAQQEGLLSFLAVPFKVRDRAVGTFNCYMGTVHSFSPREIELLSTLANQTALAVENANLAMNALLVREMHHRVKNNLQMIAMLLRLQLRSGIPISADDVLSQTISRILSIAAVHEALSQEGFRLIGVKGLIQQAAHSTLQTMTHPGREIALTVEGADFRLPSQPATSLAIAANELIQNALEHGFNGNATGSVKVWLTEEGESLIVQVCDDGIGLPADFSVRSSLGLQIVQALITEDLRGAFELTPSREGSGTLATIRIPRTLSGPGGVDAGDRGR